ncbi:MAG TPA: outer membrane beta-barrel protein [Thermoanaerobaculia bacterium]|nr:outer membrane beta-barrel protein [Thermoanaerobaculia bacterium]
MKKILTIAALMLAGAPSLTAQDWSFGAATGPFVFGDFVERSLRVGNGGGSEDAGKLVLSAETSAGVALDIERRFSDRWAIRLEGTFTRAPLSVEQEDGGGVTIDAGDLDVSTWMLPVVFRINPRGTFRFHLLAGPALAFYRAEGGGEPVFDETQSEWGAAFGGGVGWWISDRFAIEGNLTDTITSSPFSREDFPDVPGIDIPRPHNVHTTVGVRWKF